MKTTKPKFEAIEFAYYIPGKGWRRAIVRSQAQLDKFNAKTEELGATEISSTTEGV